MEEVQCRAIADEVCPSVVLVEQAGRLDYFCAGSVVWRDNQHTYILTQSETVESSFPAVSTRVRFHDGIALPAELMVRQGNFCVLRTGHHVGCKVIELDAAAAPGYGPILVLAPASRSRLYPVPGLLFQPSLASTGIGSRAHVIQGSADHFMLTLQYGGKSPNDVSRIMGGPVFGTNRKAIGILVGDNSDWKRQDNGSWCDDAFYFKIGISAATSWDMVCSMLGQCGVRKGKHYRARKARNEKRRRRRRM